jgi:hypothetical protein
VKKNNGVESERDNMLYHAHQIAVQVAALMMDPGTHFVSLINPISST